MLYYLRQDSEIIVHGFTTIYLHTITTRLIRRNVVNAKLKKMCLNKIFWSAISASFAFTILLFNITMESIDANAEYTMNAVEGNKEEIQIVHEDIKQILVDTSYIRGIIDTEREK